MLKALTYISVAIAIFVFSATTARGQEIADSSATFKAAAQSNGYDFRVENLRNFLDRYDSPLASHAEDFVAYADMYGIDYRLVPSITGVESTFGKHIPSAKSFNAYGWANGGYIFSSWTESIGIVSSTLKTKYIDKGAPSIAKIARRYAPPSTTWGSKVTYFVGKIDALPLNFDII